MASLISCIVPVFNGERFLAAALDSILAQTYQPLEVIVIDDGSDDRTAEVAAGYTDRVSYVRQANAGPADARNHGLRLARGPFVAFLDADDLWAKEKLARQVTLFEANPNLDLCTTDIQNFWAPELKDEEQRFNQHTITQQQQGVTQTFLLKRPVFQRVGNFDSSLKHRDTMEWLLRARKCGIVIEHISEVLVYRRIHENNLSRSRGQEDHEELFKILDRKMKGRR